MAKAQYIFRPIPPAKAGGNCKTTQHAGGNAKPINSIERFAIAPCFSWGIGCK